MRPRGSLLKRRELPKRWFIPTKKQTSINLKQVCGANKTPAWATYNAGSMKMQFSDMQVLEYCNDNDCFNKLHLHWLSLAAPPMTLLLFPSIVGPEQWRFSLTNLGVTSVLTMPAEKIVFNGMTFFAPKKGLQAKDLQFFPIFDLEAVRSCRITWVGPLWKERNKVPGFLPEVMAKQEGEADSLKVIAAKACIWRSGIVWLTRLANHYKVDLPAPKGLWEVLHALLKKFLPAHTESEILDIMSQRIPPDDERANAMAGYKFDDVIEAGDVEEVSKHEEQEERAEELILPFKKKFKQHRKELLEKEATDKPKGPPRKKAKGKAPHVPMPPP